MVACASTLDHLDPSPDPLDIAGLARRPRDALHRLIQSSEPVDAWSALAGRLGREVAEDPGRFDDGTPTLRKHSQHTTTHRNPVLGAQSIHVERKRLQG